MNKKAHENRKRPKKNRLGIKTERKKLLGIAAREAQEEKEESGSGVFNTSCLEGQVITGNAWHFRRSRAVAGAGPLPRVPAADFFHFFRPYITQQRSLLIFQCLYFCLFPRCCHRVPILSHPSPSPALARLPAAPGACLGHLLQHPSPTNQNPNPPVNLSVNLSVDLSCFTWFFS